MKFEVCRIAVLQNYPKDRIIVSHQDLGKLEWPGVKELVKEQADSFGLRTIYSHRINNSGSSESILDYARRRGKWPADGQRWCTSEFKREPGAKVVRQITKGLKKCSVLYCFGFRKQESPRRSKNRTYGLHKRLSTKLRTWASGERYRKRTVYRWLPINNWSTKKVWQIIKDNKLPYHYAYDLGMPRLSCIVCIYSPFNALVIAGRANPGILDLYVSVENEIGHRLNPNFSLSEVQEAIDSGYAPQGVENWIM